MSKASVVRTIEVSHQAWYDRYTGLNDGFRKVIAAAHAELEAHPNALIRQEQSDPKPTLKVTGSRNSRRVTLAFVTREQV